jgi:hypothetical protein
MTPESRNSSLLDNVLVNTFPCKRTRATIEERCFLWSAPRVATQLCDKHISAAVNHHATKEEEVFSVGAAPRLYNQDLAQLELKLNERRGGGGTKGLTSNKCMAVGSSGARCQEWPCWLVAGSKLLLCSTRNKIESSSGVGSCSR